MTNLKRFLTSISLALVFAITFSACESVDANSEFASESEAEILATSFAQELSLSTTQATDLQRSIINNGDRGEPGYLWRVAAEMQASLTDEQRERLLEKAANGFQRDGNRQGGQMSGDRRGGDQDRPGFVGPQGDRRGGGILDSLLTDEQKETIQGIRESYKEQIKALVEQKRDETITAEEFSTQMTALHDAMKAEIEAVLTAEQIAALEEAKAAAEAAREEWKAANEAVMIEVLGLTDDQLAALEALRTDQQTAREALRAEVEAGTLTQDEAREQLGELRASGNETLQGILDATQYEVWLVHEMLQHKKGKKGGRRGGPGGQRPGGN
ncbi:MAG: hypothetical protein RhofKO_13770 [Rhodothermales bacterium]